VFLGWYYILECAVLKFGLIFHTAPIIVGVYT
jgi:hypothetical protein